jgi:hypothetical protein
MIMVYFLASLLGGLAGHQSYRFTRNIESGWRNLAEHGIGGLLILPFLLVFWVALGGEKRDIPRVFSAYCAALFGVGAGVAAGWMLDQVEWRQ